MNKTFNQVTILSFLLFIFSRLVNSHEIPLDFIDFIALFRSFTIRLSHKISKQTTTVMLNKARPEFPFLENIFRKYYRASIYLYY